MRGKRFGVKTYSMNNFFLYAFILVLSGCVAAGSLPRLSENPASSLENGKSDFIELFDGQIIEGNVQVVRNSKLTVNGKEYHVRAIKSYQLKSEYRTTVKNRFITRVVKGKINLYKQSIDHPGDMFASTSSGRAGSTSTHYYLQKGDKASIVYFDVKTLSEMVKDNPNALEWVDKYKKLKKKNDSYLDNAIATYNL